VVTVKAKNITSNKRAAFHLKSFTSFVISSKLRYKEDGNTKTICSYLLELYSVASLESEVLNEMNKKIVQNFLGMIILMELRKGPLSGYDVISLIHKKFHMLLSSGTVYSYLYALERDGLVIGQHKRRKRVFMLTERGKETAVTLLNSKDKILEFIVDVFASE